MALTWAAAVALAADCSAAEGGEVHSCSSLTISVVSPLEYGVTQYDSPLVVSDERPFEILSWGASLGRRAAGAKGDALLRVVKGRKMEGRVEACCVLKAGEVGLLWVYELCTLVVSRRPRDIGDRWKVGAN